METNDKLSDSGDQSPTTDADESKPTQTSRIRRMSGDEAAAYKQGRDAASAQEKSESGFEPRRDRGNFQDKRFSNSSRGDQSQRRTRKGNVEIYLSAGLMSLVEEFSEEADLSVPEYLAQVIRYVVLARAERLGRSKPEPFTSEFVAQRKTRTDTWISESDRQSPKEHGEREWKRDRPDNSRRFSGDGAKRAYGEKREFSGEGKRRTYGEKREFSGDGAKRTYGEKREFSGDGAKRAYGEKREFSGEGKKRAYGEKREFSGEGKKRTYGEKREFSGDGAKRTYGEHRDSSDRQNRNRSSAESGEGRNYSSDAKKKERAFSGDRKRKFLSSGGTGESRTGEGGRRTTGNSFKARPGSGAGVRKSNKSFAGASGSSRRDGNNASRSRSNSSAAGANRGKFAGSKSRKPSVNRKAR